ncbi:MAG: hypothetical protein HY565_03680 [Candidatus Kerfeldbacteria bacterium]|nr:hypothetical protein [Candidatus Kerfeldbacteria bacterium]
MTTLYPKPYDCSECGQHPNQDFYIFTPTNDWIISFPGQQLFHLHFGEATFEEDEDIAQAKFVADYYYHRMHEHPHVSFFFILDMSKVDNSALISDRAKQIYRIILEHPQLVAGVVYGATTDMQAMVHLMAEDTDKTVTTVSTKQAADQIYQHWHRGQ